MTGPTTSPKAPEAAPRPQAPPSGALAQVWAALSEEERTVYERAGYHRAFGLGARPALLIVDVEYNFTGDIPGESVLDSLAKYPDSCGPAAWRSVPAVARLLAAARAAGLPVAHTHGMPRADRTGTPRRGTDIIDELAPRDGEFVVAKPAASPFHHTGLADRLTALGVDTVIHAGCTTSGCVRAGVVDAAAYGFRNAVVEEAVFDRAELPHRVGLFDMDAKYADVVSLASTETYLGDHATRPAPRHASGPRVRAPERI